MAWETIDSAPKDGSEFITCNMRQGGVKQLVCWEPIHHTWASKGKTIHMQATHWMPLPANPVSNETK